MVNVGKTRHTDRSQATKYIRVARALHSTARDLRAVASEGDTYGNAMAIIAIHAAISYADALSIALREIKSIDGNHSMAVPALQHALGHRADPRQCKRLQNIVNQKDAVSYQGEYYTLEDAAAVVDEVDVFAEWALSVFEQRP